jgi:hypothetical protein
VAAGMESYGGLDGGVCVSLQVYSLYFFIMFDLVIRLLSSTDTLVAAHRTHCDNTRVLPLSIRVDPGCTTIRLQRELASQPPSHSKCNGTRVRSMLLSASTRLTLISGQTLMILSIPTHGICYSRQLIFLSTPSYLVSAPPLSLHRIHHRPILHTSSLSSFSHFPPSSSYYPLPCFHYDQHAWCLDWAH